MLVSALASAVFSQTLMRVLDCIKRDKIVEREYEETCFALRENIAFITEYRDAVVLGDERVSHWYINLQNIMYTGLDVLEDYATAVEENTDSDSPYWKTKWDEFLNKMNDIGYSVSIHTIGGGGPLQLGCAVRAINEKINHQIDRGRRNGYLDRFSSKLEKFHKSRQESTSVPDNCPIIGRDETLDEITRVLRSGDERTELRILPIVGPGGIGKTTVAQLLFDREKKKFNLSGWIHYYSVGSGVKALLRRILSSFDNNVWTEKSDLNQLTNLLKEQVKDKTFLLVLDDVWPKEEEREHWDELLKPLRKGKAGSRLVITTRENSVVDLVRGCYPDGVEQPVDLGDLKEDHLWRILKHYAFGKDDKMNLSRFEELSKGRNGIIQKFGGLPLAAKVTGRLLANNKTKADWESISKSDLWVLLESKKDKELVPALLFSYLHLFDAVKPCFTYCSLFPKEDGRVKHWTEHELVYQWLAHDYIPLEDKCVDDVGRAITNYLQSTCLFTTEQEGDYRFIKMHDSVRYISQYSGRHDHLHISDDVKSVPHLKEDNLRHLHISGKISSVTYTFLEKCKKLRTLIIRRDTTDFAAEKFLGYIKELPYFRVLVLRNLGIIDLPTEIGELKHLRYLDLSENKSLVHLPDHLTKLYHLQVLILRGTALPDISEVIFTKLSMIRYLDLSGNRFLQKLPESITLLSDLRVLSLRSCTELRMLPEGISKLQRLECLDLGDTWKAQLPPEGLSSLSCLRILKLPGQDHRLPTWFPKFGKLRHLLLDSYFYKPISNAHLPGIGNLSSLENLAEFHVSDIEGYRIDELESMNMLRGKLSIFNLNQVKSEAEARRANLVDKNQLQGLNLHWNYFPQNIGQVHEDIINCLIPPPQITELGIYLYGGGKYSSVASTTTPPQVFSPEGSSALEKTTNIWGVYVRWQ